MGFQSERYLNLPMLLVVAYTSRCFGLEAIVIGVWEVQVRFPF